jgi:hypothetical protein
MSADTYQCQTCKEVHDDAWEAQNCPCMDDEPKPTSAAELESQGQLRLFA